METPEKLLELIHVKVADLHDPSMARLESVNLSVAPREFWVVAGLPGAGKSALLNTAAGLHRPLDGKILLFGKDLFSSPGADPIPERLKLGIVFEEGSRLFNHLSTLENLTLPLRYHYNYTMEEAVETVMPLMEEMELSGLARRFPTSLSRIQKMRLALARAMVLKPEVLLLDNPLSGLDFVQVRWWFDLLGQLYKGHPYFNGKPIALLVTVLDPAPWLNLATQFALIRQASLQIVGDRKKASAENAAALKDWLVNEETY